MKGICKKKNLFVVGDDYELHQLLINELGIYYNYYSSYDGISALDEIDGMPLPDLIISVDSKNGHKGLDFYQRLLKIDKYACIPLIFICNELFDLRKLQGLELGAIDYISRPFSILELKLKVKSIINLIDIQRNRIINFHLEYKNSAFRKYKISCREKDILKLIEQGKEYKEIANNLGISLNTVTTYVKRIFRKCNVVNKLELIKLFTMRHIDSAENNDEPNYYN